MNRHPDRRIRLSVMQLLPNALTLAALCAGLTAIRFAVAEDFDRAAALILLAAVLDGLDGRLARRLRSESAMGAELDSLCDVVNFGVAPALVLHLWAYGSAGGLGWIAALVYATACALRLARFNISSRDALATSMPNTAFTGVPSPAGAMLALLPIFVGNLLPGAVLPGPACALWMVAVASLMISRLPTPAFRPVRVRPDQARLLLLGAVALGAALLTYPWLTLVLMDLAYLLLLLLGWIRLRRRPARKDM
ncbi:CDP-alcohol phosphatidyltransferase family protein [Paracoccus fontiphilus]|uniref:CDP-alcohol phosphatidyltransferase family protein n=1 Tax=Paracoccus fontiphilus TaxID=1815556 RepID=A0ABV7IAK9_9RHOB